MNQLISLPKCGMGYAVKPVLVATCIKQATCVKQATGVKQAICVKQICLHFPKKANALKCTFIKQAPVLSKRILLSLASFIKVGL